MAAGQLTIRGILCETPGGLYLVIPVASMIGGAMVERVVNLVLD